MEACFERLAQLALDGDESFVADMQDAPAVYYSALAMRCIGANTSQSNRSLEVLLPQIVPNTSPMMWPDGLFADMFEKACSVRNETAWDLFNVRKTVFTKLVDIAAKNKVDWLWKEEWNLKGFQEWVYAHPTVALKIAILHRYPEMAKVVLDTLRGLAAPVPAYGAMDDYMHGVEKRPTPSLTDTDVSVVLDTLRGLGAPVHEYDAMDDYMHGVENRSTPWSLAMDASVEMVRTLAHNWSMHDARVIVTEFKTWREQNPDWPWAEELETFVNEYAKMF